MRDASNMTTKFDRVANAMFTDGTCARTLRSLMLVSSMPKSEMMRVFHVHAGEGPTSSTGTRSSKSSSFNCQFGRHVTGRGGYNLIRSETLNAYARRAGREQCAAKRKTSTPDAPAPSACLTCKLCDPEHVPFGNTRDQATYIGPTLDQIVRNVSDKTLERLHVAMEQQMTPPYKTENGDINGSARPTDDVDTLTAPFLRAIRAELSRRLDENVQIPERKKRARKIKSLKVAPLDQIIDGRNRVAVARRLGLAHAA